MYLKDCTVKPTVSEQLSSGVKVTELSNKLPKPTGSKIVSGLFAGDETDPVLLVFGQSFEAIREIKKTVLCR